MRRAKVKRVSVAPFVEARKTTAWPVALIITASAATTDYAARAWRLPARYNRGMANTCPKCGATVTGPQLANEILHGRQGYGRPASINIYRTTCGGCGERLTAVENDRPGQVRELKWRAGLA